VRVELPRHREVPLAFDGNRRHEAIGPAIDKYQHAYALTLFDVEGGGFAVGITFQTTHEHERRTAWAIRATSSTAMGRMLMEWVREHKPVDLLVGFPAGEQFEKRRNRTAERLAFQLDALAQEILTAMMGA
jgi:hypothetical protein